MNTTLNTEMQALKEIKDATPRGSDGRTLYTVDFRSRVVTLTKLTTLAQVARELDLSYSMVVTWNRSYRNKDVVPVSISRKVQGGTIGTLLERKAELEAELTKLDTALNLLKELGVN